MHWQHILLKSINAPCQPVYGQSRRPCQLFCSLQDVSVAYCHHISFRLADAKVAKTPLRQSFHESKEATISCVLASASAW
mmetsp:Transcript_42363/g.133486  ORF Transcript_42363/g.133486 Transcript_42363/m.133486 type:complete len:80 (+) Transcript_42363:2478-2717(+)